MAASGSNILRYSALIAGVSYGFYHQRTIWSTQAAQAAERKYAHEMSMIEKAKVEYSKKINPQAHKSNGVVSDPNDPKFDLEAFLKSKVEEK